MPEPEPRIQALVDENAKLMREVAWLREALDARTGRAPEGRANTEPPGAASSEDRFRHLFENMHAGFVLFEAVFDGDGEPNDLLIVAANDGFAEATGLVIAEVVGRCLTEVLPGIEDDDADWIGAYGRVAETGESLRLDHWSELLGRCYSVSAFQSDPGFCAVTFIDVTERRQAEESLRASEERFSKSFHVSPVGLAITSTGSGEFVEVNQSFLDLFGYVREEVIGRRATDLGMLSPSERNRAVAAHEKTGGVQAHELEATRRDGATLDLLAYSGRVVVGGVTHDLTHFVDITERYRQEDALRASEARYRTLLHQAPDAIVIVRHDETISEANAMAVELFGHSLAELSGGMTLGDLLAEGELQAPESRITARRTFRRKDGRTFPGEVIASTIDGTQFLAILRDLTETEEAEAKRRRLQEQLEASRRLEAIGLLAGGVAHDFNNLLSVILSYSDLAADALPTGDPVRDDIEEVLRAGHRAAGLTRQLLAFSRRQLLKPSALDLNAVARDLESMLHRVIGADVELSLLLADDLDSVVVDQGQIEQVILNLMVNARDAMPTGGQITLQTANAVVDDADMVRGDIAPGRYVVLAVTDSGLGMDEDTVSRMFEPFFSTKEVGKGTGLGLATVHGIISQSGGTITVDSELGRGTTLRVFLPAGSSVALRPQAAREPVTATTGTETILVVEDEEALRRVVVRTLERVGYRVLQAPNGQAALTLASEHSGDIHLLLTDMIMPKVSGRGLADDLRKRRPSLQILYMSGYANNVLAERGILEPDAQFLNKPFTGDQLARMVRLVLDGMNESRE
ncbi:MAG: PAS domain S-box protein [Deltaproteobacteria bacterium]|nr:PAS domain S-box protein [Deltaproteobacteria bacterium]